MKIWMKFKRKYKKWKKIKIKLNLEWSILKINWKFNSKIQYQIIITIAMFDNIIVLIFLYIKFKNLK
jgi:hypothetical protein